MGNLCAEQLNCKKEPFSTKESLSRVLLLTLIDAKVNKGGINFLEIRNFDCLLVGQSEDVI